MEDKYFKNEDITKNEYDDIFRGRSHENKIKMHYNILKNNFEKMSDDEFRKQKNFVESRSKFLWHDSRSDVLKQINDALLLIAKFNEIKKQFLYVDYQDEKWEIHGVKFSSKLLDSLCTVLHYTAIESYFRIKLYMDWEKMGIYRKNLPTDSEEGIKGLKSQYFIELEKLETQFGSVKWVNARNIATKMIQSL